jgi:hypothetical protein
MKTGLYLAGAVACLVMPGVATATTSAGVIKTWVSTTGRDTGTCPITAPCQSFQYAHDQAAPGGEIDVKDSGGYGLLVITKAITIMAPSGVLALINVPAGSTGITVNTTANDVVTLRGLILNGHGVGRYGIREVEAQQLIIEDSTIQGMADTGIDADLPAENARHYLSVTRDIVRNNKTGLAKAGGQNFEAVIADSYFSHNSTGLMNGGYNMLINHCTFEHNVMIGLANAGVLALSGSTLAFNGQDNFDVVYSTGDNTIDDIFFGTINSFQKK